ncbi:MAG: dCTP deaminase [Gemmatimonadales bacterium]|nr:MAG: dCTP deaminase [Gemmatimonadales bacterium]
MVLSDQEIRAALDAGDLIIDPRPQPEAYATMSVDLRLGSEFRTWGFSRLKRAFGGPPSVYVSTYDWTHLARDHLTEVQPGNDGCVSLEPNSFMLAVTEEKVGFPLRGGLAGRIEGRSSLARLGLSVHFAPTLHLGWEGKITLELHNVGSAVLKLKPGDYVCQLIVEKVSGAATTTMQGTRFYGQQTPAGLERT